MGRRGLGRALQIMGLVLIVLGIIGYIAPSITSLPVQPPSTPYQTTTLQWWGTTAPSPAHPVTSTSSTATSTTSVGSTTTTTTMNYPSSRHWIIRSLYGSKFPETFINSLLGGVSRPTQTYTEWIKQAINDDRPSGYKAVLTSSLSEGRDWHALGGAAEILGAAGIRLLKDGHAGVVVTAVVDNGGAYFVIHGFAFPSDEWVDLLSRTYLLLGEPGSSVPLGPRVGAITHLYNEVASIHTDTVLWRVFIKGRGSYLEDPDTHETIPVKGAYLLLEIPRHYYRAIFGSQRIDYESVAAETLFWDLVGYPAFSIAVGLIYPENADTLTIYADLARASAQMISSSVHTNYTDYVVYVNGTYAISYSATPSSIKQLGITDCSSLADSALTIASHALGLITAVTLDIDWRYSDTFGLGSYVLLPSLLGDPGSLSQGKVFMDVDRDGYLDGYVPLYVCGRGMDFATIWSMGAYGPQSYPLGAVPPISHYFQVSYVINYSALPDWARMLWDSKVMHVRSAGYASGYLDQAPAFYVAHSPQPEEFLASPTYVLEPVEYAEFAWEVSEEAAEEYSGSGSPRPETLVGELSNTTYIMPLDGWVSAVKEVIVEKLDKVGLPPGAKAFGFSWPASSVEVDPVVDLSVVFPSNAPIPLAKSEGDHIEFSASAHGVEEYELMMIPEYEGIKTPFGTVYVFHRFHGVINAHGSSVAVSVSPVPSINGTLYRTIIIENHSRAFVALTSKLPRDVILNIGNSSIRLRFRYPPPPQSSIKTVKVGPAAVIDVNSSEFGLDRFTVYYASGSITYGHEGVWDVEGTYLVKGIFAEGFGGELIVQVYGLPPGNYTIYVAARTNQSNTTPPLIYQNISLFSTGLTIYINAFVAGDVELGGFDLVCLLIPPGIRIEVTPA